MKRHVSSCRKRMGCLRTPAWLAGTGLMVFLFVLPAFADGTRVFVVSAYEGPKPKVAIRRIIYNLPYTDPNSNTPQLDSGELLSPEGPREVPIVTKIPEGASVQGGTIQVDTLEGAHGSVSTEASPITNNTLFINVPVF